MAQPDFTKKVYTANEISSFNEKSEVVEFMYIAQKLLGKTLSASDVNTLLFFYDVLGFDSDLIVYLLESYQQIVILIAGIYPLGDGINFDIVLPQVVDEQGSLRSMSAQSAQVFNEYQLDYSFVDSIFKFFKTFSVERHS